ncbi:hypothetical protein MED134_15306 [Dokdonia sp. MED134]|nr:hypothetical protein MED134_15306 [Dokdonia sp. MED134]
MLHNRPLHKASAAPDSYRDCWFALLCGLDLFGLNIHLFVNLSPRIELSNLPPTSVARGRHKFALCNSSCIRRERDDREECTLATTCELSILKIYALGIFESCLRRGRNDREEGTRWRLIEQGGSFKILADLLYNPSVPDP